MDVRLEKKGAELSVNLIIVAILALLVLVIMSLIFTGRIGIFRKSVDSCTSFGGSCVGDASMCAGSYQRIERSGVCDLNPENDPNSLDDGLCCVSV